MKTKYIPLEDAWQRRTCSTPAAYALHTTTSASPEYGFLNFLRFFGVFFIRLHSHAKRLLFEIKIVEKSEAATVRLRLRLPSTVNIALVRLGMAALLSACCLSSC